MPPAAKTIACAATPSRPYTPGKREEASIDQILCDCFGLLHGHGFLTEVNSRAEWIGFPLLGEVSIHVCRSVSGTPECLEARLDLSSVPGHMTVFVDVEIRPLYAVVRLSSSSALLMLLL